MEVEENKCCDYTKLSAAELSALVVGKEWDRQADQEAIRRLRGDSQDVLGELLLKLVPAVVSVATGRYFVDLKKLGMQDDILSEVYIKMQHRTSWATFRGEKRLKNWLGGHGGIIYDVVRRFVEKAKKIVIEVPKGRDRQIESTVGTCGKGIVCRAQKGSGDGAPLYEQPLPFSKMPTESNAPVEKGASAESDIAQPVLEQVQFPCGSTCDTAADAVEKGELITVVKGVRDFVRAQMTAAGGIKERNWRVYYEAEDLGLQHKVIAKELGISIANVAKIRFSVNNRILAELNRVFRRMGVL